jgi:hypothetical protein
MKVTKQQLVKQTKGALKACIERLPSVSIKSLGRLPGEGAGRGDLLLELGTSSGTCEVIVAVRSSGQPRFVREAIGSLLRLMRNRPSACGGVITAPYISRASARICEESDIGFVDFVGNCRLRINDIFIERSGEVKPTAAKREHKSLFTPKAARILRVLLKNPKTRWHLASLGKEAGVSLGQVYNVKELLLDQELITVGNEGIALSDPDSLLKMWASASAPRRKWIDFFTLESITEIEAKLAKLCKRQNIPYALMGFSAAARYAPVVRSGRAMAYVSADEYEIARKLGLKEVASGANVTLAFPFDEGVYYDAREIDGMQIVSPLQAWLDLARTRGFARRYGRGDEAAQMILDREVRPKW